MATPERSFDQQAEQEERMRLDEQAFQLRSRRYTYRKIGEKMNISHSGAYKRVQRQLYRQRNVLTESPQDTRDFDIAMIESCSRKVQKQARQGNLWAFALLMQSVGLCHRLRKDTPDEVHPYLPWNMSYASELASQPIVIAPQENRAKKPASDECFGQPDPGFTNDAASKQARAVVKECKHVQKSREQLREQSREQPPQALTDKDVHTTSPLPKNANYPPGGKPLGAELGLNLLLILIALICGTLLGANAGSSGSAPFGLFLATEEPKQSDLALHDLRDLGVIGSPRTGKEQHGRESRARQQWHPRISSGDVRPTTFLHGCDKMFPAQRMLVGTSSTSILAERGSIDVRHKLQERSVWRS